MAKCLRLEPLLHWHKQIVRLQNHNPMMEILTDHHPSDNQRDEREPDSADRLASLGNAYLGRVIGNVSRQEVPK